MEASALLQAAEVILDDRIVLRAIDLQVGPGVTLVRGQNGAGKTTLLRALAGLVPLARGTRRVEGEILYLGHRPQLHRALSAAENLSFFARYRGLDAADVAGALASWGVPEGARPADRLSAGQRRRASLARLEVERCPLVLLDEPFAELDDEGAAHLAGRITACGERGQAVVIATHGHAGQRRRASLARLEVERCPLVLLDEPFAELDDEGAAHLAGRIAACGERGQVVVIATHGHAGLAAARTVRLQAGSLAP